MARRSTPAVAGAGAIRCAVYTRKSTEEGLEQEYNSLDAQFDACAAYIASQRHEGWTLVRDRYDDGGFSGGTMERPGLKRLLTDVAAGRVQVIVLYKVDRLTRSLADFSKIVEVLDRVGASFVSVTQAFNTTTSMGRLMLNVLLSFAQFEREVTGERIRDKVAASKKKGLWMGGPVPLGYDVISRKLVVNEAEAATVNHLFQRYLALGCGEALLAELREQGIRTKQRRRPDGQVQGGVPFARGSLFNLLGNRLYLGEMVHKGVGYPGEHAAIVTPELFQAVADQLAARAINRRAGPNLREPSLLAGILVDGLGRRMTPSHAVKQGRRYRYYNTHASELANSDAPAWRMPAHDMEAAVVQRLRTLLTDWAALRAICGQHGADAATLRSAIDRAAQAAERLGDSYHRRRLIPDLVTRVNVGDGQVEATLDAAAFDRLLGLPARDAAPALTVTAATERVRRGKEVRLVLTDDSAPDRDGRIVALLTEARAVRERILAAPTLTLQDHAQQAGQCRHRMTQLFRLAHLAPDIVDAIIAGTQPAQLSARALLSAKLPPAWDEQKRLLGLA